MRRGLLSVSAEMACATRPSWSGLMRWQPHAGTSCARTPWWSWRCRLLLCVVCICRDIIQLPYSSHSDLEKACWGMSVLSVEWVMGAVLSCVWLTDALYELTRWNKWKSSHVLQLFVMCKITVRLFLHLVQNGSSLVLSHFIFSVAQSSLHLFTQLLFVPQGAN